MTGGAGDERRRNRLLSRLPAEEFQQFAAQLEPVALRRADIIYMPHAPIAWAYFPLHGVISLLAFPEPATGIEVATVGNEGMVGLPLVLGGDTSAHQAVCQVAGQAYRVPAADFSAAMTGLDSLRAALFVYAHGLFTHVAQTAACNRHHLLPQRCARWLLEAHDRVDGDVFQITHEYLAQMLGVRRATVSGVVGDLQGAGVIRYRWGTMTIVDRSGLERAACGCYSTIRREYDRLLPL